MNNNKKLRVLSLFSGIGAFEKGLVDADIDYEVVGFSEIDKYAIESYCAIHNVDKIYNLGDISKVNIEDVPDCDLVTFGFPCQPFSQAGMRLGFEDDRGNMFFEAYKIIKHRLPKYFIFENVQGLLTHDGGNTINVILKSLGMLPYEITMDLMNAKDFGIPQNRSRLFCIGRRID